MGIKNPFVAAGLFPSTDVQVTSSLENQSRSESTIVISPVNPNFLVAASKKFINPHKYQFTLSTSYSVNGGITWKESPPLQLVDGADGMTDPALAFDNMGNAYLVVEPLSFSSEEEIANGQKDLVGKGMYVYKWAKIDQPDETWGPPIPLHPDDPEDDKQWIAADLNESSDYYGHIYVVWGASSPLRFARSTDNGETWKGVGTSEPGSQLVDETFSPEVSVGTDGTVHIVWHIPGSSTIEYMRSINGGETFEGPKTIVNQVKSLWGNIWGFLSMTGGWPHFENATFRVLTIATGCGFGEQSFIVAWSDCREGWARIYYTKSVNSGETFEPEQGLPLLSPQLLKGKEYMHHFHPQIGVTTETGVVGCAFYEFGLKQGKYLIDVIIAGSWDGAETFSRRATVTDKPWDPVINAPWSHYDQPGVYGPWVTFIGEYFGLDADDESFAVLWTDTRTGVQELFFDRVDTRRFIKEPLYYSDQRVIYGLVDDTPGMIWVNGKPKPVHPDWSQSYDILQALLALDVAEGISHQSSLAIRSAIFQAIEAIAKDAVKKLKVRK